MEPLAGPLTPLLTPLLAPRCPAVRPVGVDAAVLDTHLAGWDHADAYAVEGPTCTDALTAARALFDLTPTGRRVLGLRDLLVRPLGLEPASTADGMFPVLHRTADLVVLGMDDRHLDFRVLLEVGDRSVRCTTAVRRRPLGRVYFAVVGPLHRRIVPGMLGRAARRGWSSRG